MRHQLFLFCVSFTGSATKKFVDFRNLIHFSESFTTIRTYCEPLKPSDPMLMFSSESKHFLAFPPKKLYFQTHRNIGSGLVLPYLGRVECRRNQWIPIGIPEGVTGGILGNKLCLRTSRPVNWGKSGLPQEEAIWLCLLWHPLPLKLPLRQPPLLFRSCLNLSASSITNWWPLLWAVTRTSSCVTRTTCFRCSDKELRSAARPRCWTRAFASFCRCSIFCKRRSR